MIIQKNPKRNLKKNSQKKSQETQNKLNFLLVTENSSNFLFKKFTNLVMRDGKKIKASQILFEVLVILKKRLNGGYLEKKNLLLSSKSKILANSINSQLFHLIFQAIENVTPNLEVRKVRVRGSTYLVPAVLNKKKQETLALKWLIESAKKRQKNSKFKFSTCLADEIYDASRKLGYARQKRDELHRLAQMNRAYIRYRWW